MNRLRSHFSSGGPGSRIVQRLLRLSVIWIIVILAGAASAQAQDAPPVPLAGTTVSPRGSLTGLVLDRSGNPRPGVAVRLREDADPTDAAINKPEAERRTWLTVSRPDGTYSFEDLPAGFFKAQVMGDFTAPISHRVEVRGGARATHHLVGRTRPYWISGLVFGGLLLYGGAMLAFRHHNIVHTNREHLAAQLDNIATRIPLESDPARASTANDLKARLEKIREHILAELTWREWFFWSRGREIGGWSRLHEVERQLVAFLVPEARVIERAVTAEVDLRKLGSAGAVALADRMRATMAQILTATSHTTEHAPEHLLDHLKQQLAESLSLLYSDNDTRFSVLMEWHNKAMWLVYLACLVILLIGLVYHHEEIFLVGAAGGLMSRMTRSLFREDVPNDYGASWTTLFLSPLLGAIAAWFGIAVIMWAVEIGLLGQEVFGRIDWDAGPESLVIGIAFTLGFSERLFTSLLSTVDERVTTAIKAPAAGAVTSSGIVPVVVPPGPQSVAAGTATTSPAATAENQIVAALDLLPGERAAVLGSTRAAIRDRIAAAVGVEHLFDATAETLVGFAPLDAVLVNPPPAPGDLPLLAQRLREVVRAGTRVVVVGQSQQAMFDADAVAQQAQGHSGPALVKDTLTTATGLAAEEPPAVLNSGDPVSWMYVLVRATE